ncbi:hypothetical protein N7517_010122 [Penicillium concentricum]|uniref:PH domain-containing protein n=1 Tax=Penicillium concentricum TaxID=293559 RepID=A0A9W9RIU3_9EURO|nr:uncharacterized protein N7517_010122 [Penicillium concentricum]KAJ5360931.1 hypothetical protein N7517_010122 [Penicillium concentricum]
MSSPPEANGSRPETDPRSYHEHYHGLQTGSYTDQQLRHASANHLHMTNRRFFVGPIPEGWLQGHRKSWYKSRLRVRNYTSQTVSFSADPVATHYGEQGDRLGPSLPDLDEEAALALTNTSTEAVETQDDEVETETQEEETAAEPVGELQTLTHPEAEASGDDPLPEEDTETSEHSGRNNEEGSGGDSGDDSGEDTDSTPKARTSGQVDIYGNDVSSSSFVTAREEAASSTDTGQSIATIRASRLEPPELRPQSPGSQNTNLTGHYSPNPLTPNPSTVPSEADSATQLLRREYKDKGKQKSKASGVSRATLQHHDPQDEDDAGEDAQVQRRLTKKVAKFNLDDNIRHRKQKMRSKIAKTQGIISANRPHRRKVQDGEIVKAEKMLVCVEETLQTTLPADYTENDSLRMETRTMDKWREFLVVCRKISAEHTPFAIQMYRTRVIPDVQRSNSKTPPYYEVRLSHRDTHVNLYSPLDKTIVIWRPCKRGTKIFILRPKSAAHSAEWFTFIRQVLGWRRPTSLPINVPDLGVSLTFKNPFDQLETELKADNSDSEHAAAVDNKYAAATIIRVCMEMLEGRAEWAEVLKAWSKTEKMGLAWKRYDRLEWIFGVNEEKMHGTMAMQSSHELELRPRHHYATTIRHRGIQEEPAPIEGFLVRLTSQKGVHQRMNKMFFKRLYFFTQDHYLFFCRPAKAFPPQPPKCAPPEDGSIPTAREILKQMPLSWDIDPYPLENGEITWLSSGNQEFVKRHDEEAYAHVQRNTHNISQADGCIDMCRVQEVRHVYRGSCPADPNIGEGPSVDFHPEPRDSRQDDGATREFDDHRTFEMVLDNGLVIRLQAYDGATRDEWIKRLDALVKYWHTRCADDAAELKAVRKRNLKLLDIDEAMESVIGQFAKKWEVKKAEASPYLHNMCSLSGCRTIKMSGHLFRKPRRHTTFHQCHVILTAGKLLIFRSTLRSRTGTEIPHIHQELEATIELEDCYIYSGLITENDLLYANQTFDSNNPGLHALPRVYLDSDAFTSRDEDTAITFVVWQPLSKSYFRAQEIGEEGKAKRSLRHVSTLGKHGRTIVFKARSRVEKDRWVMSISSEIDRLQEEKHEDIRLVSL